MFFLLVSLTTLWTTTNLKIILCINIGNKNHLSAIVLIFQIPAFNIFLINTRTKQFTNWNTIKCLIKIFKEKRILILILILNKDLHNQFMNKRKELFLSCFSSMASKPIYIRYIRIGLSRTEKSCVVSNYS